MSNPSSNPPPLPSEVFYKSVRTYRNLRAFTLLLTMLVIAAPWVLRIADYLTHHTAEGFPVSIACIGAAFFLFGAFFMASNIIRNVHEPIEIDVQGIRSKHNF